MVVVIEGDRVLEIYADGHEKAVLERYRGAVVIRMSDDIAFRYETDGEGRPIGMPLDPRKDGVPYVDLRPIRANAQPNPGAVGELIVVTALLPPGSLDTEVVFQLVGGQAYVEAVADGQAGHAYVFTQPGVYEIAVSSAHHDTTTVTVEVVVQ